MNTSDTERAPRRGPSAASEATRRSRTFPRVCRRTSLVVALGALSLGAIGIAQAARYGVHVVDALGEPVAGASVCIGIEGSYRRFGAVFTDARGRAELLDVPAVPLVVTVSRTRFSGMRFSQPALRYDLVREVVLESGTPGPRCKAGSSLVANPPDLDVLGVEVARIGGTATLRLEVSGEPSHYRIGRDETLEYAPWQRFETSVALPDALASAGTLHVQVRRLVGEPSAWIEALSEVVEVTLPAPVAQP